MLVQERKAFTQRGRVINGERNWSYNAHRLLHVAGYRIINYLTVREMLNLQKQDKVQQWLRAIY